MIAMEDLGNGISQNFKERAHGVFQTFEPQAKLYIDPKEFCKEPRNLVQKLKGE